MNHPAVRHVLVALIMGAASPIQAAEIPLSLDPTLYEFAWDLHGKSPTLPRLVVDNGRQVFLKFDPGSEIPTVFAERPDGLVLLPWKSAPPYIVVPNLRSALRLKLHGDEARVTRHGYFQSDLADRLVAMAEPVREDELASIARDPIGQANTETYLVLSVDSAKLASTSIAQGVPVAMPNLPTSTNEEKVPSESAKAVEAIDLTAQASIALSESQNQVGSTNDKAEVQPPVETEPLPSWQAAGATTLRQTIEGWSASEGWGVRWESDELDYPIEQPFTMFGEYLDVVTRTFELYQDANRPFKVEIYPAQKLVVVKEKK